TSHSARAAQPLGGLACPPGPPDIPRYGRAGDVAGQGEASSLSREGPAAEAATLTSTGSGGRVMASSKSHSGLPTLVGSASRGSAARAALSTPGSAQSPR
ncbi:hypothetical protein, partial [Mycobacterium marinum]|uniref:hypothetical protein n=1 Tax=Mycobacterium marinum TaxID=1781 RepID=UPI003561DF88